MKKEQKDQVLAAISADIQKYPHFYITDIAGLNAGQTFTLRRECFNQGIKLTVVKNTFLVCADYQHESHGLVRLELRALLA